MENLTLVGVGGKITGPCGRAIPLVRSPDDPEWIVPIGCDTPRLRRSEWADAVVAGTVTPMEEVSIPQDSHVGWVDSRMLQRTFMQELWRDPNISTAFEDDVDRQVKIAPKQYINDVFSTAIKTALLCYVTDCVKEDPPLALHRDMRYILEALLYVADYNSNLRRYLLVHLGHLYGIKGDHVRLKQLHLLEIERAYCLSFDAFFDLVWQLQDTIRLARRYRHHDVENTFKQLDEVVRTPHREQKGDPMINKTVTPTFPEDLPTKVRVMLRKVFADGCTLRGFRSGGGLRVISIEDEAGEQKGYGEHYDVMTAIEHATEAYLAGGRSYAEQYGDDGLYDHYHTGSSEVSCPLDAWLLQGHSFRLSGSGASLKVTFEYVSMTF